MTEFNTFLYSKNDSKLKKWIYSMFFSTKGRSIRIKIIQILFEKPKSIQTIATETNMSYFRTRYHVHALTEKGFLIQEKNTYVISKKFYENYYILDDIIGSKLIANKSD